MIAFISLLIPYLNVLWHFVVKVAAFMNANGLLSKIDMHKLGISTIFLCKFHHQ